VTDLAICKWMNGWRYEWVRDLPPDVYDVILEEMAREREELDRSRETS
jgi:hypothetical protein